MKLVKKVLMGILAMSLCTPSIFAAQGGVAIMATGKSSYTSSTHTTSESNIDYGETVNLSTVQDNIKVTIEKMKTDTYQLRMLVAIETVDGTPLKGNVNLDTMDCNFKNEKENADEKQGEHISGGSSYGMISDITENPCKVYYEYEVHSDKPLANNFIFQVENITEEKPAEYDLSLNLYEYLKAHPEVETIPQEVDPDEAAFLENLKKDDPEEYEDYMKYREEQPKNLLKPIGLNLEMAKEKPGYTIDNIGFVDGKLHILVNTDIQDRFRLDAINKAGEFVDGSMSGEGKYNEAEEMIGSTQYYIWDIESIEELKDFKVKLMGNEIIRSIEGPWEIEGTLDQLKEVTTPQKIKTTAMIDLAEDKKIQIKDMALSNLGIYIKMQVIGEMGRRGVDIDELNIRFKMTDGTIQELDSCGASYNEHEVELTGQLYSRNNNQVASILINDEEIKVQN